MVHFVLSEVSVMNSFPLGLLKKKKNAENRSFSAKAETDGDRHLTNAFQSVLLLGVYPGPGFTSDYHVSLQLEVAFRR
jgi:hypothetical protein